MIVLLEYFVRIIKMFAHINRSSKVIQHDSASSCVSKAAFCKIKELDCIFYLIHIISQTLLL